MIKYNVSMFGKDGADEDFFDLERIERPEIVDKAGRKQWLKESKDEVRTLVLKDIPVSELGSLLRAVADAASYYVHGKSE
jgi:hypothetical protein